MHDWKKSSTKKYFVCLHNKLNLSYLLLRVFKTAEVVYVNLIFQLRKSILFNFKMKPFLLVNEIKIYSKTWKLFQPQNSG